MFATLLNVCYSSTIYQEGLGTRLTLIPVLLVKVCTKASGWLRKKCTAFTSTTFFKNCRNFNDHIPMFDTHMALKPAPHSEIWITRYYCALNLWWRKRGGIAWWKVLINLASASLICDILDLLSSSKRSISLAGPALQYPIASFWRVSCLYSAEIIVILCINIINFLLYHSCPSLLYICMWNCIIFAAIMLLLVSVWRFAEPLRFLS